MRIIKAIALILVVLSAAAAVLFILSPSGFWSRIAGDPDMGAVDFPTLSKTEKPNQFLMCPPDFCKNADPDAASPIFEMTAQAFKAQFLDAALKTEGTVVVEDTGNDLRLIARSPLLRFPDTISTQFIDRDDGTSTLAVYARAQIGHSDFGANEARVRGWLAQISP